MTDAWSASAGPIALLALAALTLAFGEAVAGAGEGMRRWLGGRSEGARRTFGEGFLLGLGALGTALMGLGLTGLFFPWVLLGAAGALLAAGRLGWRRLLLVAAAREWLGDGPAGRAAALAALASFSLLWLFPVREPDILIYHLGLPWQSLLGHAIPLESVPAAFHLPLPADLTFAFALLAGDERLAKGIGAMAFLAAGSVVASTAARTGWLGLLLALGSGPVLAMMGHAKNDLVASAWLVAGLWLVRRRAWLPGAVLAALGVAGKLVYAPLAVAWCLAHRPGRRPLAVLAAAGLAIPLPWLLKTWLATGTPLMPFPAVLLPSPFWGEANVAVAAAHGKAYMLADTFSPVSTPVAWAREMFRYHALALLALPLLLLRRATRGAAVAVLAGQILILYVGHRARYLLPSAWLAAVLAVPIAAETAARRGRWIGTGISVLALAAALASVPWFALPWSVLRLPLAAAQERLNPTFTRMLEDLASLGPRRVLTVGEMRTYRLPARVVYGGIHGETPVIWRAARESPGPARFAVKMRQLGTPVLAYNFVTAGFRREIHEPFAWDDRMLRLYAEFVRGGLRIEAEPPRVDHVDGGYYLYRIGAAPREDLPLVYYLPGAEGMIDRAWRYERAGVSRLVVRELQGLFELLPDVGFLHTTVAYAYFNAEKWRRAFSLYGRTVEAGMVGDENWYVYAVCAAQLNLYEPAMFGYTRALSLYPERRVVIRQNLATLEFQHGNSRLEQGDMAGARGAFERSLLHLEDLVGRVPESDLAQTRAYALIQLAYSLARTGRPGEAERRLEEAARIFPDASRTEEGRRAREAIAGVRAPPPAPAP